MRPFARAPPFMPRRECRCFSKQQRAMPDIKRLARSRRGIVLSRERRIHPARGRVSGQNIRPPPLPRLQGDDERARCGGNFWRKAALKNAHAAGAIFPRSFARRGFGLPGQTLAGGAGLNLGSGCGHGLCQTTPAHGHCHQACREIAGQILDHIHRLERAVPAFRSKKNP